MILVVSKEVKKNLYKMTCSVINYFIRFICTQEINRLPVRKNRFSYYAHSTHVTPINGIHMLLRSDNQKFELLGDFKNQFLYIGNTFTLLCFKFSSHTPRCVDYGP